MPDAVASQKPAERSKRRQRGITLAEAYFLAQEDKETEAYTCAREDLAQYCLGHMTMLVRASVYGSGFYPRGLGPQVFADECISVLHEKYTQGIDTLESPESVHAFLGTTVRHAMIDQMLYYVRRPQEPLEKVDEEGQEIQILDEEGRDAALQRLAASIVLLAEGDEWARAIENRDLLKKALAIHTLSGNPHDAESGCWIQNTWENPSLSVEDIAKTRKSSVRTVYRLLIDDNNAVIKIAKNLVAQKPERAGARVS
jgi:hypothetical protein